MDSALSSTFDENNTDDQPHFSCNLGDGQACEICEERILLESRLKIMAEQLRKLKTQTNRSHDRFILRVSPEIASYIFQLCISTELMDDRLCGPLTLGAVCHDWRQIAWSIPQLWSIIPIFLNTEHLSSYIPLILEWIGRSKELPISILLCYLGEGRLDEHDINDSDHTGAIVKIFDTLKHISHRWKTLYLNIPACLVNLFPDIPRPSPYFLALQILTEDCANGQASFHMKKLKPKRIKLEYFPLKSVDVDWSNVTWIEVCDIQVDACYVLFKQAPQLRYCSLFTTKKASISMTIPTSLLVHPFIQEFKVRGFKDSHAGILLDGLTFPNLKRMTLESQRVPRDALKSFFERSSCELRELYVQGNVALPILRKLPTLVKLGIYTSESDQNPYDIFRLLARYQDMHQDHQEDKDGRMEVNAALPLLLPKLKCIKFTVSSTGFPWTSVPPIFGRISELKSPNRRPLKSLHIQFERSKVPILIDLDVLPLLLALNEAGMDIRIFSGVSGRDALKPHF